MNLFLVGLESIRLELNFLNDHIEETAKTLIQKQEELAERYKQAREQNPEDEAELDMYFSDEFHRYHELFPTFTFNSMLVSQFTFFETRLKFLCELQERKGFSNVKVTDLNGSDIEKCKKYLVLVAELSFENLVTKWKEITDIQKIRNAIVHHASRVPNTKENEYLVKLLKNEARIEYNEQHGDFYIQDVSFLQDFSKLIIDFFKLLVEKLSKANVQARNTTMPYNNDRWGQEKSETLLKEILWILKYLKENEARNDENKDIELKSHVRRVAGEMLWDLTKLYAFFSDGQWDPKDRDTLVEKGEEGLEKLRKAYNEN